MVGAFFAGLIADWLGRRAGLFAGAAFVMFGTSAFRPFVLEFLANKEDSLDDIRAELIVSIRGTILPRFRYLDLDCCGTDSGS